MSNNKKIHYCWRLLLHVQQLNRTSQQSGYAMLLTSIVSILVFSMLSVYLFSTNLYKSVASATVDSGTTFYAAETGLNRRAYQVRQKFDRYATPIGLAPAGANPATQMQTCINSNPRNGLQSANDFECRVTTVGYGEASVESNGDQLIEREANSKNTEKYRNTKYRTYSFVNNLGQRVAKVPTGEMFAGLNMIENSYRVYTTAAKEVNTGLSSNPVSAQTMLQMDFNDRWIPIFQFAAFYENDLEVTTGTDMFINGPVHTNGNLRLLPGALVTLAGKTTSAGNMFKSLGYQPNHGNSGSVSPRTVRVMGGTGGGVAPNNYSQFDVGPAWGNSNEFPFTTDDIQSTNGGLSPSAARLNIPPIESTDRTGIFYQKADVRVDFDPNNIAQPFRIKALGSNLSDAALRSLMQPVVFRARNAAEQGTVCQLSNPTTVSTTAGTYATLNAWPQARKDALLASMQTAIARESLAFDYSWITSDLSTATGTTFYNSLIASFVPTATELTAIKGASMAQIARLSGSCIVPAPMQVLRNQLDRRELRSMQLLQANINSIVAWNRDGLSLEGGTLSGGIFTGGTLTPTSNLFFNRLPAPSTVVNPNSYLALGLASADNTDAGLVWHFSMNSMVDAAAPNGSFNYNAATKTYSYKSRQSPFGFAVTGGKRLPGALSIVSDQAVYTQGDYNFPNDPAPNPTDQKPAAVMADTIAILSNQCLDNKAQINCLNLAGAGTALPVATNTTVFAGFLSKTDNTDRTVLGTDGIPVQQSGGLNNYMRLLENWNGQTLTYVGSFVSTGVPIQSSGRFLPGLGGGVNFNAPANGGYSYFFPPIRNFGFDTSFNTVEGLPPLAPRANYLKQKVFRRDYSASDR
jgi:hypothetical protein